jgi:hypothetical protein
MIYKRLAFGAALVALFVTGLVGLGVRTAFAAVSHVSPSGVEADTTTLYWSGQGDPVNQQCGGSADPGAGGYANGATASSYMLWIFTTDGGGVSDIPTLTINNVVYGNAFATSTSTWQIVTPYINPSTIVQANKNNQSSTGGAFTTFTVGATGSGSWGLKISHGCAGSTAATPTVTKTAAGSYNNTYTWTVTKSADTTRVYSAGGGQSSPVNYTVNVSHDPGTIGNVKVTGQITVTNPNPNDPVAITGLTDTLSDGTTCAITNAPASLPPGNTVLNYECDLSALPTSPLTNTVEVDWDTQTLPTDGSLSAGSASFTTPNPVPFTPTTIDNCISVSDPLDSTGPHAYCVGDPGDPSFSFGYSATFTNPSGTCTSDQNTATGTTNTTGTKVESNTVTVTDCQGADLTVTKTAVPSFTRTYTWGIAKAVDNSVVDTSGPATVNYTVSVTHDNGTDSNWLVTGVITVTNPNDWEAVAANVTDAIDNGGTCVVTGGTNVSVPASGHVDLPYTCTYASAPTKASGTNTATATWDPVAASTTDSSATGTATADFSVPTSTNPTIVDGIVSVSDTLGGLLRTVDYTDPSPTTFTYPITFTDPAGTCTTHDNTATFTTNSTGTTSTASQSVMVCVGADLQVSKTAATSFTRTYGWSIVKQVDNTKVTIDPWASATFHYTVTMTHDTGTDSAFAVAGTITVNNPNNWEAVTANVADTIDNGGSCTVTGGTSVVIPASGSVQLPYSCSFNSNPVSGTNTATATWNSATSYTPHATMSGTAGYTFGAPTTVKGKCFTATDTFNGGSPLTLGVGCISPTSWTTDPGNTLANFHEAFSEPSFTLTYARTIHAPAAGTCVTYLNTAKFTPSDNGTGGSGGASVYLCAFQAPFTVGYWGNHLAPNGTSGCTGVPNGTGCSSNGPWANQYLPQPLGTYSVSTFPTVAKVIAANNCSNAATSAQNAIGCLAAQLLAAELNVKYGANTCIVTNANGINAANAFLSGIPYIGPTGTYTLSATQRNTALTLKNELVNYNQGGGC